MSSKWWTRREVLEVCFKKETKIPYHVRRHVMLSINATRHRWHYLPWYLRGTMIHTSLGQAFAYSWRPTYTEIARRIQSCWWTERPRQSHEMSPCGSGCTRQKCEAGKEVGLWALGWMIDWMMGWLLKRCIISGFSQICWWGIGVGVGSFLHR